MLPLHGDDLGEGNRPANETGEGPQNLNLDSPIGVAMMFAKKWFSTRPNKPTRPRSVQPRLEALEDRCVPTITYGGGALLQNVETQAVFYGTYYQGHRSPLTHQTISPAQKTQLEGFLNYITSGPYLDRLSEAGYNVAHGSNTPSITYGFNTDYLGSVVPDSEIRGTLQRLICDGTAAAPDANRLYVVFVEPNVEVIDDNYTDPKHPDHYDDSVNDFSGYHQSFIGADAQGNPVQIRYAIVPTPGGTYDNQFAFGVSDRFDSMTVAASHEIAEAVTDPDNGGGWTDGNKEIADLAVGFNVRLNGYLVTDVMDQKGHIIFPADLQVTGRSFDVTAGATFSGSVAVAVDNLGTTDVHGLFALIDWGDGTVSHGSVQEDDSGIFIINGTHVYNQTGQYKVHVTVKDALNAQLGASADSTADVHLSLATRLGNYPGLGQRLGDFLNP
jgi:hypothetical protein